MVVRIQRVTKNEPTASQEPGVIFHLSDCGSTSHDTLVEKRLNNFMESQTLHCALQW